MSRSDLRTAMLKHGSCAGHRPVDPGAAPERGADRPAGGERCPEDGSSHISGVDRPSCACLSASWPRLGHDLRTPLNAILGNAELLLDGSAGPLSREARACLGDIQSAAGRMMRHVQALLELGRARSRPALAPDSRVDLLALLAAEAVARSLLPIRIAPGGARFVVHGDAGWLQLLASVLAELYLGDGLARGPLHVSVDHRARGRYGLLRLWWVDLHPEQVPALPLALTDAILDLHDGTVALSPDGIVLCWPWRRMMRRDGPAVGGKPQ